jgi:hypothetical protein
MKIQFSLKRTVAVVVLAAALGGAYPVRVAYTADLKLDQAEDSITLAINLLLAADFPDDEKGKCEKPRDKAIRQLEKVLETIERAKTCADESASQP